MAPEELINYQKVQNAARHTLDAVLQFVIPGASEADLVKKCDKLQRTAGVDDYWYKNLPAVKQHPIFSTNQRPILSTFSALLSTVFSMLKAVRVITCFQDIAVMRNTIQ